MKRLLVLAFVSILGAPLAVATTNYINYGLVSAVCPPQVAPQIDASNFVNYGTFYITNLYASFVQPPLPYESWNTRNWTNANLMAGDSGFRFDYFDSVGQTNGWSANFQNAGNVNVTNANIFGASYVLVSATNINNKGTMAVAGPGLMTLNGKNIDLVRGTLGATGNETNDLAGVLDDYWGVDNGNLLTASFSTLGVSSSFLLVTEIQVPYYFQMYQYLQLTPPFTTYIKTSSLGANLQAIDVLFLRQTNPAITTEVRFDPFNYIGSEKMVQWQALLTNRVTGAVLTNQLYLDDSFAEDWYFPSMLVQTMKPSLYYTLLSAATYHPYNYTITHGAPFGYDRFLVMNNVTLNPYIFVGTNFPTYATNAGYAATLTAAAFNPDPSISGSTFTNVPGRIEITAAGAGSALDLTRTLMNGQSYLLLSATNHFVGSTNATIVSPISDFYLASTNGMMAISNLTTPFVPRICGEIEVWSGRWTNVTPTGILTYYNVTMVDSRLDPQQPSQIQNLSLRSTNLLIGDALNVFGSLLLDTVRLTISTNELHAPTPNGELNLTSGDLTWSASLPKLAYLTNYGKISSANSIFFGGARTPPWFSGTYDEPYQSFVTHGLLIAQGDTIWANYFEASGTNNSGVGPIGVQAGSAIVTNGVFQATDADITLTCGSLLISNQVLRAGRSITLTVTNYLDDGSVSNSVDAINGSVSDGRVSNRVEVVTNQNNWTAGGGINLLRLPPKASLLATTVTNNAFANAEVDNTWAGKDYGCWPSGFVNNAALGRLILDGQDSGSLFAFWRTDLTNALYVDLLELKDATVNADIFGNLVGVYLQTNFTIYYGDAVWNGLSIAEQINGRYGVSGTNGGRFCWVSNYNTGFFSSTNVMYSDHSVHRLNRALVTSCWIDSNGNGTPNCVDPDPVPIPASITTQPQGQNVNQYSNAVFTVVATGSPPPTYQWRFNGAPISGATGSSYTRTNVQPSDAGSYLVVVSNSTATVTSTNAILTVTPVLKAPVLKVVVTDPPPRSAPRSLVLSWSTIPRASNYLYAASSLPTTNWQLVTNFLSPTNAWEATATDQVKTNGGRYYRVRVLSP